VTHEDILKRLTEIVANLLEIDDLVLEPGMTARDVPGWDSLVHVQIIVASEKAFGVRFRTGEIAAVANVGELVNRVAARMA
jgi:acyl carrier protein